jgi:hypothetical protein
VPPLPYCGAAGQVSGTATLGIHSEFVVTFRPTSDANVIHALRRALKFAGRACGLRAVSVSELKAEARTAGNSRHDQPDLFTTKPTAQPAESIAGLEVEIERPCRHCGLTIAIVVEGKGPHTAALECARCGRFRKWLPRICCVFLTELVTRCGRPVEPIRIFEQVNRVT